MLVVLSGCGHRKTDALSPALNEIQFIGSHNSYKQAIEPALLQQVASENPTLADSLEYSHIPLPDQLDLGLRNLELDLYYDPEGGRYASPLGLRLATTAEAFDPKGRMKLPGFKVLHVQDLDFRSSCLTLADCLAQLKHWSELHSQHSPIVVTVNAKDEVIERPGFVRPLAFDAQAWNALDAALKAGLGQRIYSPDELRGGEATLMDAIRNKGWPELAALEGRFLFVLDEPPPKLASYLDRESRPVMFVNAEPGTTGAAIRIINDPLVRFEDIQNSVEQGLLVRTRADADTVEARSSDTSRRDAAFASGAQIVTTDYYIPATGWRNAPGTGYVVTLPHGGFTGNLVWRCNPVTAQESCMNRVAQASE